MPPNEHYFTIDPDTGQIKADYWSCKLCDKLFPETEVVLIKTWSDVAENYAIKFAVCKKCDAKNLKENKELIESLRLVEDELIKAK